VKLGVKDPEMSRLKGIYRRTWYDNQILFHNAENLLKIFHESNMQTLLLKGTALIPRYYKDYGLRAMQDLDILVHTEDAAKAIALLSRIGWKPTWRIPEGDAITSITHSCDYVDKSGRRFDLHWHVMLECCQPDADRDFWAAAVPVKLRGVETLALCPTDQLLHVCVHGARWDPTPPFRWVADAMILLRTSRADIDWDRLLRHARERQLTLPMRDTLKLLVEEFDADIPPNVMLTLETTRPTMTEKIDYRVRIQPLDQTGPVSAFISNYWYYSRSRNKDHVIQRLRGLPRFLQEYWGISSIWYLPLVVVFRTFRRTSKLLRVFILDHTTQIPARKDRPSFEQ
jgi:hypothetical protein